MSRYALPADLTTFGLPAAAISGFNNTQQQAYLDAASSTADSYLAAQYRLPLVVSPQGWGADLTKVVCELAAYDMLVARGFNPEALADSPIKSRYDQAMEWLKGISKGEIHPVVVDAQPSQSTPGGAFVLQTTVDSNGTVTTGAPTPRGW